MVGFRGGEGTGWWSLGGVGSRGWWGSRGGRV